MTNPPTRIYLAQSFAMEWSMLWKDLAVGFIVGGLISAFVPDAVWQAIFLKGSSPWLAIPVDALLGPLVAIITFVCSIGNVPLAAILWAGGASFAGVLSFIYADLIVLPLLDTYRRYFGWRFAAYLFGRTVRLDGGSRRPREHRLLGCRSRARARPQRARAPHAFRGELHVLAEPGVRAMGGVAILGGPTQTRWTIATCTMGRKLMSTKGTRMLGKIGERRSFYRKPTGGGGPAKRGG